jgi:Ca-activated chloride channel homolog
MPTLTLAAHPQAPELALHPEPQVCYLLLHVGTHGPASERPVSWALLADASRSMRIPIVDEERFRELVRSGGAQETLVDGVPVWQLGKPLPAALRADAPAPLEYVARALHTIVEQLDAEDRFALVACAERALLLAPGAAGAERATLAQAIGRLPGLSLGERTDLAAGLALALEELRAGRTGRRAERIVLLTDGFTERPAACLELASTAASERIAISTLGLGGEFEETLLTELADRTGGRALFLADPAEVPRAVAAEFHAARSTAAAGVALRIAGAPGVVVRRVTRIRPALAVLYEGSGPAEVALGDLVAGGDVRLLLELLAPPHGPGPAPVAVVTASANDATPVLLDIMAYYRSTPAPLDETVRDAAARGSVARLQRRAMVPGTLPAETARLLRASAARLDELGEHALAGVAREQAATVERTGRAAAVPTKELTYATRRLGEL